MLLTLIEICPNEKIRPASAGMTERKERRTQKTRQEGGLFVASAKDDQQRTPNDDFS